MEWAALQGGPFFMDSLRIVLERIKNYFNSVRYIQIKNTRQFGASAQ